MSTEILGADGPRTKYIFGVCVQQAHGRNVTSTSSGVAFAPQQGGFRPTKNTSSVSTVLKIFKTPRKDLGGKEILKKEEHLRSNIST